MVLWFKSDDFHLVLCVCGSASKHIVTIHFSFLNWLSFCIRFLYIDSIIIYFLGLVQRTPSRGSGSIITWAGNAMPDRRGLSSTCAASTPNRICSVRLGHQSDGWCCPTREPKQDECTQCCNGFCTKYDSGDFFFSNDLLKSQVPHYDCQINNDLFGIALRCWNFSIYLMCT